jgi:hypothetical protein
VFLIERERWLQEASCRPGIADTSLPLAQMKDHSEKLAGNARRAGEGKSIEGGAREASHTNHAPSIPGLQAGARRGTASRI